MCICIENLKIYLGNCIEADKFFPHPYSYTYEGKLPTQLCNLLLLCLQKKKTYLLKCLDHVRISVQKQISIFLVVFQYVARKRERVSRSLIVACIHTVTFVYW